MKKIISIMVAICLLYTNVFAEYFHIDLPDNNNLEGTGLEYYTTDTSAMFDENMTLINNMQKNLSDMSDEERWNALSDGTRNQMEIDLGIDSSSVANAVKGGKAPFAAAFGTMLSEFMSVVCTKEVSKEWDYAHNIYSVWNEWKEDRDFGKIYPYSVYYSHDSYHNIFNFCKRFKWDYVLLLSKWRWQSGNQLYLENNSGGPCNGLAGQLLTEDGRFANVAKVFTEDEIKTSWDRNMKSKMKPQGTGGGLYSKASDASPYTIGQILDTAKESVTNFKCWTDEELLTKAGFLYAVTNNEKLNKAKEKYMIICELMCLATSVTPGKTRGIDNLDATKVREICFKEEPFSDSDLDFLFADIMSDDTVYKEYDNLPEYKQHAYIFLKHWSSGCSDSGQGRFTLKEICDYVKNNEFKEEDAKTALKYAYASQIAPCVVANGLDATMNLYNTIAPKSIGFHNNGICDAELLVAMEPTYAILGVNQTNIKNYIKQDLSVNEIKDDIFVSDFEKYYDEDPVAKGCIFIFSGFFNKKLDAMTITCHGMSHAGYATHYTWKNLDTGRSPQRVEQEGVASLTGVSIIHYLTTYNWWLYGTWVSNVR